MFVAKMSSSDPLKRAKITEDFCERVVTKWFGPLADELALKLVRLRTVSFKVDSPYRTLIGVPESKGGAPVQFYEIVSPHFTLRIRVGVGPWTEREETSFIACIVPTEKRGNKWDEFSDEVGVGVVASFYGDALENRAICGPGDFEWEVEKAARLSRRFCKPFLLGKSQDFPRIWKKLDDQIHESTARIRKMLSNMPPNVKPMWRKEGESHAEWVQRLEVERKAWEAKKSGKPTED
jgi:hypothetical protein